MRPSLPVVAAASSLTGALAGALLALLLGIVEPGGGTAAETPSALAPPAAPPRDGPASAAARPLPPAELRERRGTVQALAVLRRWDDRRARAWVRGDPTRLRALYSPGSRAGRRDVALLREYAERGWAVRRVRPQVVAAEALARTRDRVEVRVVEHDPVDPGTTRRAAARVRVVALVRSGAGWQVERVAAVSGGRR